MLLPTGRSLGPYVVRGVLGQDEHAAVYRVRDERSGVDHALEVLRDVDERRRRRVEEIAVLGHRLQHPNVVAPTEVVDVDGQPGLLMELVVGPSLERWLHADAPDDLATRLRVFRGAVAGCAYAHAQGVVHRGLRPSRVLLHAIERDGRPELVARVTGFGLAEALASERSRFGGLTTLTNATGTSAYAAPEQSHDPAAGDARADVYSLGCLLYELVCGVGPFAGSSPLAAMQDRREGRYRDPREFVRGLPEELHGLVVGMLQPDPSQRPPSCAAVLGVLDELLADLAGSEAGARPGSAARGEGLELGTLLALCGIPAAAMLIGSFVVFLL